MNENVNQINFREKCKTCETEAGIIWFWEQFRLELLLHLKRFSFTFCVYDYYDIFDRPPGILIHKHFGSFLTVQTLKYSPHIKPSGYFVFLLVIYAKSLRNADISQKLPNKLSMHITQRPKERRLASVNSNWLYRYQLINSRFIISWNMFYFLLTSQNKFTAIKTKFIPNKYHFAYCGIYLFVLSFASFSRFRCINIERSRICFASHNCYPRCTTDSFIQCVWNCGCDHGLLFFWPAASIHPTQQVTMTWWWEEWTHCSRCLWWFFPKKTVTGLWPWVWWANH